MVDRVVNWNAVATANIVRAYAPIIVDGGSAVALSNPELTLDQVRERMGGLGLTKNPDLETTTPGNDAVVQRSIASTIPGRTAASGLLRWFRLDSRTTSVRTSSEFPRGGEVAEGTSRSCGWNTGGTLMSGYHAITCGPTVN